MSCCTPSSTPPKGRCRPAPIVQDCEPPEIPAQQCANEVTTLEYDPATEKYTLVGQWMDENCEQVLDENNQPILTPIQ